MDASEFEWLLYNMLSEEPFENHILDMTDEKDDYTISDYVSHFFCITIGETWTCLTCHEKKQPKYQIMTHLFCHWEKYHRMGKK